MSVTTFTTTRARWWPLVIQLLAAVLLAAGVALAVYSDRNNRVEAARAVTVQAEILADSVSAALAFDDPASARSYVNALARNPQVEQVTVFDAQGRSVADFHRSVVAAGARIVVEQPVTEKGARLGRVYLRTVAEAPVRRFLRIGGVGLMAILASLVVAGLGFFQSILSGANAELEVRARDLADANRQLEQQMREREMAEEALRQSQKMEAIGQLTGGVAHDFNNLLMVASSGLDLLERTDDPAKARKLKDGIRQAIDRGATLTRQLLTFSRRAALRPQSIDVAARIGDMQVLLDRSLREDIRIETDFPPDLWPVEADPAQLELAVLNIAVNARDAMPDGGVIRISAANHGVLDGDCAQTFVRLSISDTGKGMDADLMGRIFEPFFTTKGVGVGTGLGLSQVYGFTRASGGDVKVESAPGRGTTITLFLPRSQTAPAEAAASDAKSAGRRKRKGRILIVEDDDRVADLVLQMVAGLGYVTERASTAAEALERLDRGPDFDLVLSDMVMPGKLNGLDLARAALAARPERPVLLTTGFSEAAQAASTEGFHVLLKPYGIDTLAAELDSLLPGPRLVEA